MLADTGQLAGMTALFDSRMRERMRGANAAGSAEVQPSKVFYSTWHLPPGAIPPNLFCTCCANQKMKI